MLKVKYVIELKNIYEKLKNLDESRKQSPFPNHKTSFVYLSGSACTIERVFFTLRRMRRQRLKPQDEPT